LPVDSAVLRYERIEAQVSSWAGFTWHTPEYDGFE
jgi:hypothetical protein